MVAIAAPRGFAKSTAITHSYTLAEALFRQSKFIIIVSDTESQASLFLGDIKSELLENEDLIHLFGITSFEKMNETDIIVKLKDGYRFRIIAKGAEQKLRGTKWDGLRPDLIVIDDLEGDENSAARLQSLFIGIVDVNKDGEITDDEEKIMWDKNLENSQS